MIDYSRVNALISAGKSQEEIKQELIFSGVPAPEVDEVLAMMNKPSQPGEPPPANSTIPTAPIPAVTTPVLAAPVAQPANLLIAKKRQFSYADLPPVLAAVLVGYFFGLAGALVAIGLFYGLKGLVKKNFKLFFGGIGIAIVGGVLFTVLAPLLGDLSQDKNVSIGNDILQITLPNGVKKIESTNDFSSFGILAKESQDIYTGQVIISTAQKKGAFSADQAALIESQVSTPTFKKEMQKTISNSFCSGPRVEVPEKITVAGAVASYKIDFICPNQSDGSQYRGSIIEIFSATDTFRIVIGAEKNVWVANASEWNAIVPSLRLSAK